MECTCRMLGTKLKTDGAQLCSGKQQTRTSLDQQRATLTSSSPAAASKPLRLYLSEQTLLISQRVDMIGHAELTLRRFPASDGIDHVSPEKLRYQARERLRRETPFAFLDELDKSLKRHIRCWSHELRQGLVCGTSNGKAQRRD